MNLTATQTRALGIIREKTAGEPNACIAVGPGTDIRCDTARALARHGLVVVHGKVTSRPCRAGYGRAANAFSVLESDSYLVLA